MNRAQISRDRFERPISTPAHSGGSRNQSPSVGPADGSGRWIPFFNGMSGVNVGHYFALAGWMCIWVLANMGCSLMSRYRPLPVLHHERDHLGAWQIRRQRCRDRRDERDANKWMRGSRQESMLTIFGIWGRAAFFRLTYTARIIHTRPWRVFRLDGLRTSLPSWAAQSPFPNIQLE